VQSQHEILATVTEIHYRIAQHNSSCATVTQDLTTHQKVKDAESKYVK